MYAGIENRLKWQSDEQGFHITKLNVLALERLQPERLFTKEEIVVPPPLGLYGELIFLSLLK